jgi:hypothetical protein
MATTMDATGLSDSSAFALLPLIFLFWYIDRLSRLEMGFRWGKPTHFALALLISDEMPRPTRVDSTILESMLGTQPPQSL